MHYPSPNAAHLKIHERREAAIRDALGKQLGVRMLAVEPFGLEGSASSTPLRITVADPVSGNPDRPCQLFGKLYAPGHLHADRWHKLRRRMLYGRLEDELKFQTVRRLVQYEDYMLHSMHRAGLPVAEPYGFCEITPEREYLLVTSFIEGAREIGEAEVDATVIDDGLRLVRRMWDAGVSHRDVKPANLLVVDEDRALVRPDDDAVDGYAPLAGPVTPVGGRVRVIDVAFGQVRPSAWRQAVDLANMMIVLGLRSDAERVYRAALRYFTEDDIAGAFAAARGETLPGQSRRMLKRDQQEHQRDLVAQFRALAPSREPVATQWWSTRRVGLLAVSGLGLLAASLLSNLDALGLRYR